MKQFCWRCAFMLKHEPWWAGHLSASEITANPKYASVCRTELSEIVIHLRNIRFVEKLNELPPDDPGEHIRW